MKNDGSSRINFIDYGKTISVITNDTDEGRQLIRRVEFNILREWKK